MKRYAPCIPESAVPGSMCERTDGEYYLASDIDAMTDGDLPPMQRTHANLWQAKYFEALVELRKANKGAARLRRKLDRILAKTENESVK